MGGLVREKKASGLFLKNLDRAFTFNTCRVKAPFLSRISTNSIRYKSRHQTTYAHNICEDGCWNLETTFDLAISRLNLYANRQQRLGIEILQYRIS